MSQAQSERPRNIRYDYIVLLITCSFRFLQLLLFWLPVKKNRVMISSHLRKGFSCSPKYVVNELLRLYGNNLEIIWVSSYPETCDEIVNLGIKVIKCNSFSHIILYLRTHIYLTNDSFPCWASHRRQQIWINTWHGAMNYKHIGYDYLPTLSTIAAWIFRQKNRQPEYFLSGSKFFTNDTAQSFHLSTTCFLPSGLPRNDIFFTDLEAVKSKVYHHYDIGADKKVILFAPTFRADTQSHAHGMDFAAVRASFSARFGGEWVILFRSHNFVQERKIRSGVVDASDYADMQELLCAADILISDYSSCLYDFCLTGKPAFVFSPDIQNYRDCDRSFAFPITDGPYPVAETNQDLIKHILEFDDTVFRRNVAAHLESTGSYDRGTAAGMVAKIIGKYCIEI